MSHDHYSCGSIIQNVHQGPKLLVPNWDSNNAYYTHPYDTLIRQMKQVDQ